MVREEQRLLQRNKRSEAILVRAIVQTQLDKQYRSIVVGRINKKSHCSTSRMEHLQPDKQRGLRIYLNKQNEPLFFSNKVKFMIEITMEKIPPNFFIYQKAILLSKINLSKLNSPFLRNINKIFENFVVRYIFFHKE